ncbi:unnamed protein product (macronuclear) [Paramecium tetraurelia]|uniref:Opioid growth factor receptor (OGFr) conserved domain-containing protein n=1 Tax=Paramecium tetraurelia TaxID=5888 RepID=A0BHA9_PARTE|nr:uncharacterized protein GSPATT00028961001 [Paramecium tetraurelia]CAK57926.1 unnamed protein product [Paramecium tetraurelia]|eukprot:XP_001425324.1 hypothetical protein (macronuclear) [Paramecium tetraurelia strain d4-2]
MQSNQHKIMRNYDFYNNENWKEVKLQIQHYIELFQKQTQPQIQNIEQFYQNLEYDHSFIQWMFPNFYQSMFNSNSQKLTLKERDCMIKSDTILKRYHQYYILILRFYGIEIKQVKIKQIEKANVSNQQSQIHTQTFNNFNNQQSKDIKNTIKQIDIKVTQQKTNNQCEIYQQKQKQNELQNCKPNNQLQQIQQQFQLPKDTNNYKNIQTQSHIQNTDPTNNQQSELVLIDKKQFELCCLQNTHHLLRLKRILASLSVLKHRKEAIQLCQFLKKELTNMGRENIYQENFSGFDRYYEEMSERDTYRAVNRRFNSFKYCYVDKDLLEQVDISIIQ